MSAWLLHLLLHCRSVGPGNLTSEQCDPRLWACWHWPLRPEANARCRLPPFLLSLTCLVPSVDVRWRPLVSVAVVTTGDNAHQRAISHGGEQ